MKENVTLSGRLDFLNLGELLQILGNNASTGTLRLLNKYAQNPGIIYIENGNPVDASDGFKTGLDALFALFGWVDGRFEFCQESVNKKNVINKNKMEIILDGSRKVDEGEIKKLGPVSFQKQKASRSGRQKPRPVIKGPIVDYMYVVEEIEYLEGDKIFSEGNHGNWMWVILDGTVEIVKDTSRGPLKLLRLGEGSYVGNIVFFLGGRSIRSATATALTQVHLGVLDSQLLSKDFSTLSIDMRRVITGLHRRLRDLTTGVTDIYTGKSQVREFIQNRRPFLEQGKMEERLFMITQGTAAIGRKTKSGYVPLFFLSKGDFFGNLHFVTHGLEPHSASVFASDNLKVTILDTDTLDKEYEELPQTFHDIIENCATCISLTTMIACELEKRNK